MYAKTKHMVMYSASTIGTINLKILRRYIQLCKGIHIISAKNLEFEAILRIYLYIVLCICILVYPIIGKMETIAYQNEWIRRLRRPTGAWRRGSSCSRSSRLRSYGSASQAAGLHECGRRHPGPEDEYSSSLQNRPSEKNRYF